MKVQREPANQRLARVLMVFLRRSFRIWAPDTIHDNKRSRCEGHQKLYQILPPETGLAQLADPLLYVSVPCLLFPSRFGNVDKIISRSWILTTFTGTHIHHDHSTTSPSSVGAARLCSMPRMMLDCLSAGPQRPRAAFRCVACNGGN